MLFYNFIVKDSKIIYIFFLTIFSNNLLYSILFFISMCLIGIIFRKCLRHVLRACLLPSMMTGDDFVTLSLLGAIYTVACTVYDFLGVVVFLIYCSFVRKDKAAIKSFYDKWGKLPNWNKLALGSFTVWWAIPNRVFIHNGLSTIQWAIVFIGWYILVYLYPLALLILLIQIELTLTSYGFAHMYQQNTWFQTKIQKWLFGGDSLYAQAYFAYFWGNMKGSAWKSFKALASTFAVPVVVGGRVWTERQEASLEGHRRTIAYMDKSGRSWSSAEIQELDKFNEAQVLKTKPVACALDATKAAAEVAWKYFGETPPPGI